MNALRSTGWEPSSSVKWRGFSTVVRYLPLPSLLKAVKQQWDDEHRKIVDLDEIYFLIIAKQNI